MAEAESKGTPQVEVSTLTLAADSAQSNKVNRQAVKATVIGIRKSNTKTAKALAQKEAEPGMSKQLGEDPFFALTEAGRLIAPPFDMLTLAMLPEHSTELNQCIEAMETNIEGFGHRFVPRISMDKAPKEVLEAAAQEKVDLENFFMYASLRDSFTCTRRRLRRDLETTGNGYLEVIRNAAGKIQGLVHLPGYQMRLGRLEEDQQKVDIPILELQPDRSVKVSTIPTWERFRLFAQSRAIQMRRSTAYAGGYAVRWFKEFGDPRVYDFKSGEEVKGDKLAELPEEKRANEVIHFKMYSPRSPYGLPRFIGNLLSIFGDRAAEEINYVTFRNNNIPSMMLLVSNGQLTEGTIARIQDFVESQIQGSDNYSKFLIIEAEGMEEGEDSSQVKVDTKPLVDTQHKDALFQNYSANNQDKIRRAFRLPPIFVGRSDDYTRSTAEASRKLADEQVFGPERNEFDELFNRRLFPDMGIIYHRYRSNSPNTTDNQELVKILGAGEKTGGMTPRIARLMLEDILGRELPPFAKDFDPDMPFSLLMAEAVKNKADPAEPGQQVTALKTLELIEKLTGGDMTGDDEAELAKHAVALNHHFEKRWRESLKAVKAATEG